MKEQENKMIKIVNNFGIRNQLKKLSEEVFELQESVIVYDLHRDESDLDNIKEELADVLNLTNQIKLHYNIEDNELNQIINSKVDRTINRIKDGYYNNHH